MGKCTKSNSTWNYQHAKELMKQRGLSVDSVAESCAMTPESLAQNLFGRKPSPQTVRLLAHTLGCSEGVLLSPARGKKAS